METLTVAAINVNGLRDIQSSTKAATICHLFSPPTADVICLLDTRLDPLTERRLTDHWTSQILFAHNTYAHTNGIAILFPTSQAKVNNCIRDAHGRYAILDTEVRENKLLIIPVYAPAKDPIQRKIFFQHLHQQIDLHKTDAHNIVLLGDFNLTEDEVLDRAVSTARKDPSLPPLKRIQTDHHLEDFWRRTHPDDRVYTFQGAQGALARLDRIYTSRQYRNLIIKTDIIPFVHSDHDIVQISLRMSSILRGNGVWTLDNEVLQEPAYTQLITSLTTHWRTKKASFPSLLEWWDAFKLRIKRVSKHYTRERSLARQGYRRSLDRRLKQLHRRTDPSPSIQRFTSHLQQQKKLLEEDQAKRHVLHAKAQWVEEGERCSKFFLNLTKKRKQDTTIHALTVSPTKTVTTSAEIVEETKLYYQNLYTASPVSENLQNVLLAKLNTSLTPVQTASCEGLITAKEIKNATYNSNRNKSPGCDGLTLEFYLKFFDILKDDFLLVANSIPLEGSLSSTQRNALITCLPKEGDLTLLKNWRPISLLNTDYKIISKVIAERLYKVLPTLISEDQTCNLQNRKISYNLSLIRDVIAYANSTEQPYCILTVDQMKAFDKVDWGFLRKLLLRLNFGPAFQHWVRILYHNITSQIKVNGYLSDPFFLHQGVRQGCPLSPLLYVLYAEVLAENIRQHPHITGISLPGGTCTISQYADDTTLFLQHDASLYALRDLLQVFQTATGAVVNPDKCHGLWLGSNRYRLDTPFQYKWSSHHIKILGLVFGDQVFMDSNFYRAADKYYRTLHLWSGRHLSMKGKKIVINQLAQSQLVYPSHVFVCPAAIVQQLHQATLSFFNAKKRIHVDPAILHLPVPLGGMGLLATNRKMQATRLTWVSRLFDTRCKGKWRILMRHFLNLYRNLHLGENVFKTFISCHRETLLPLPLFYRTLLTDWVGLTGNCRSSPTQLAHIYHEPIFHNPFLATSSNPAVFPHPLIPPNWYRNALSDNLLTLGDICHQYRPGFHTPAELIELTGYPRIAHFINRLTLCMPVHWYRSIQYLDPPSVPSNDIHLLLTDEAKVPHKVAIGSLPSRQLYLLHVKKSFSHIQTEKDLAGVHIYTNWERKFGRISWPRVFQFMYRTHTHKPTTDVQYKHIHGKLVPRVTLHKAKLQDDNLCTRCNQFPEDLNHIFLDCVHSRRLWSHVISILALLTALPRTRFISPKLIVIGFVDEALTPPHLQVAEDVRSAFFYAVWTSRNASLWDHLSKPLLPLFSAQLQHIIADRYNAAFNRGKAPEMCNLYAFGRLFSLVNGTVHILL